MSKINWWLNCRKNWLSKSNQIKYSWRWWKNRNLNSSFSLWMLHDEGFWEKASEWIVILVERESICSIWVRRNLHRTDINSLGEWQSDITNSVKKISWKLKQIILLKIAIQKHFSENKDQFLGNYLNITENNNNIINNNF